MAHFAKVVDGKVTKVVVISNEDEDNGAEICRKIFKDPDGTWIQGSYNGRIRNKMPGIGDLYDEERDIFYPAKPFESWILLESEESLSWTAPVKCPENTDPLDFYVWDEELHKSDTTKGWRLLE